MRRKHGEDKTEGVHLAFSTLKTIIQTQSTLVIADTLGTVRLGVSNSESPQ